MPLSKLKFKPGINRDRTNLSNMGGWYDGNLIRFRDGYPEKIGGWQAATITPYVGEAVKLYVYALTTGAEVAGLWWAINTGVDFETAMNIVISTEEMAIISSIIGFWFGSRHWDK
jgi:hypothetical protein